MVGEVKDVKFLILQLIFLLALCSKSFCETVPPPPQVHEIIVPATLSSDPVKGIRLGKFLVEFEATTLKQIRDTIGYGAIAHLGDAGGSQYWLCYSQPGQFIWFISHGEMGGLDHVLTQVIAVATNSDSRTGPQCPVIPSHAQPILSSFGWVGISKKDLFELLGQPSGIQNNRLMYYYSGKKPGTYKGVNMKWDVTAYIEFEILNNKVISVSASHITSY